MPATRLSALFTEKIEPGVVVEMPTLFDPSIKRAEVPETMVPLLLKYATCPAVPVLTVPLPSETLLAVYS